MLLESVAPVVSTIRSMEEDDGVPLSYPYPVATLENPAATEGLNITTSSTDNDGRGKLRNINDKESALELQLKTQNSRQFGRITVQHTTQDRSSSGISASRVSSADNLTSAINFPIQNSKLLPSSSSSSVYGGRNVQSKAAAAAKKWKSAIHSSSKLSSKVRYAQGHTHTHTHTQIHTLTHKHTLTYAHKCALKYAHSHMLKRINCDNIHRHERAQTNTQGIH